MKIQIKNCLTDKIIYETEAKNFKEAVEKAVRELSNLSNADFSEKDLSNTNLRSACFQNASFFKTNLTRANLSNANLQDANLQKANLSNARLSNTNLLGANIIGSKFSALFFKTKATREQIKYITETLNLFEVIDKIS